MLDLSPSSLQSTSNAWLGRQTHLANVLGYLVGYLDLGHSPLLRWLGGGQFRKLTVISCAVMVATVGVTCWTQAEEERPELATGEGAWEKVKGVVRDVSENVRTLPTPVKRVCYGASLFLFLMRSSALADASHAARSPVLLLDVVVPVPVLLVRRPPALPPSSRPASLASAPTPSSS